MNDFFTEHLRATASVGTKVFSIPQAQKKNHHCHSYIDFFT